MGSGTTCLIRYMKCTLHSECCVGTGSCPCCHCLLCHQQRLGHRAPPPHSPTSLPSFRIAKMTVVSFLYSGPACQAQRSLKEDHSTHRIRASSDHPGRMPARGQGRQGQGPEQRWMPMAHSGQGAPGHGQYKASGARHVLQITGSGGHLKDPAGRESEPPTQQGGRMGRQEALATGMGVSFEKLLSAGGIFRSPSLPCALPLLWKGAASSEGRLGKMLLEFPHQAHLQERGEGWMGWRHSRLIQWLVLFAVVHPGQHCPPQTFLLWGQQKRVSTRVLKAGLFMEPL